MSTVLFVSRQTCILSWALSCTPVSLLTETHTCTGWDSCNHWPVGGGDKGQDVEGHPCQSCVFVGHLGLTACLNPTQTVETWSSLWSSGLCIGYSPFHDQCTHSKHTFRANTEADILRVKDLWMVPASVHWPLTAGGFNCYILPYQAILSLRK